MALNDFYNQKAKEILEYVKTKGLDPKETIFIEVDNERILFAVANTFVSGIPHWSKGRNFIFEKARQQQGSKIFEVVFNSTPAVAYLNNSTIAPEVLKVIAHVYGHSHIFKHNIYEYSDETILSKLRTSMELYEEKSKEYPLEYLDLITDFAFVSWNLLIPEEIKNTDLSREKETIYLKNSKFDKFLGIRNQEKSPIEKLQENRELEYKKISGVGNRRIYEYILSNSPVENWFKYMVEIEIDLLKLITKKSNIKIVHEGFASWIDNLYSLENQENFDFVHSTFMTTRVSYPSLDNPYFLGYKLLKYAEKYLNKNIPEYVVYIDDYELISECFTEEFFTILIKDLDLEEEVEKEDKFELFQSVKKELLSSQLMYKPIIFIDDYSSYIKEPGYVYLEVNSFNENRKLKLTSLTPLNEGYAVETLHVLEKVWRGPILLRYAKELK